MTETYGSTFLATTALEEFWDTSQHMLFAGEWCRLHSRRHVWEGLDATILPYPWDDRKRYHQAHAYTTSVYEDLLGVLTEWLNSVHGTDHGLRYWRIVIGPFLLWYVQALFDRYTCLEDAVTLYPDLGTIGIRPEDHKTPLDMIESYDLFRESDAWNLQIFSQLAPATGRIRVRYEGYDWAGAPETRASKVSRGGLFATKRVRTAVRGLLAASYRLGSPPVAWCQEFMRPAERAALALRSRLRVWPMRMRGAMPLPGTEGVPIREPDVRVREGLRLLKGQDQFSELVLRTLATNMPLRYVEHFEETIQSAKPYASFGRLKVVANDAGWYFNEPLKAWVAESSERRATVVGVQHGGGYGDRLFSSAERHEREITDRFVSWGWKDDDEAVIPLPAPRLLLGEGKSKGEGDILLAGTGVPRYLLSMDSAPTGSQYLSYLLWQRRFLGSLSKEAYSRTLVRLYLRDYGWDSRERLLEWLPYLRVEVSGDAAGFTQRLRGCRIFVGDNVNTTYLQALASNKPTVLFWDTTLWEHRAPVTPYYDELRRVGIFHDTPESAATKVSEVYEDVGRWWARPEVQRARTQFCERFARTSQKWSEEWTGALLDLVEQEH